MSRTRRAWLLIVIIVLGIGGSSFNLTSRSVWFDESFSWRLIQFSYSEMIARTAQDVHPPLYYVLLKSWATVFGSSLVALRSFSVFCFVISLFGAYIFTAFAFRSKWAGYIATVLLAISGWAISYAGEARMYTLGMALALFSSYALLRAVREKSFLWFGLYGVLGAALVLTHYYGFFTIAAQVLFVLGMLIAETRGRIGEIVHAKIWWGALMALIIMCAIFVPWAPVFIQQSSQVREAYWVPEVSWRSLPETFYQFFVPSAHIPSDTFVSRMILFLPLIITCGIWMLLVAIHSKNRTKDAVYFIILLGLFPFVASIAISFLGRSLYNDRFFAFAGVFVFVAIAGILDAIRGTKIRTITVVCVLIGLTVSTLRYWNEIDLAHTPGLHAAVREVFNRRTGNEPILVSSSYIYFAVLHYAEEEFGKQGSVYLYSKTGQLTHFSGAPIATMQDIAVPEDVAKYTGNVWVVDTTGFTEQPFIVPRNWAEESKQIFPEVFVHQGDIIVRKFQVRYTNQI